MKKLDSSVTRNLTKPFFAVFAGDMQKPIALATAAATVGTPMILISSALQYLPCLLVQPLMSRLHIKKRDSLRMIELSQLFCCKDPGVNFLRLPSSWQH